MLVAIFRSTLFIGDLREPPALRFASALLAIFFCTACCSKPISEIAKFPDSIEIVQGPILARIEIDNCEFKLPLTRKQLFYSSKEFGDAVFYEPEGTFNKKFAPYLYKPDVEHYSDVGWSYIGPTSKRLPWFGLRCTTGYLTQSNDVDLELSCPAVFSKHAWRISDPMLNASPGAVLSALRGQDWEGFAVYSPSAHGPTNLQFCLSHGNTILMGQSRIDGFSSNAWTVIKGVIEGVQFTD